jgi:hypothetical protein
VSHFQAQNNNRTYLDNIHMDHIYTQYKGLKVYGVERYNQSVSNFDDKASDNPDIPLGDNCSMNNTSDINDCISIDSDYEGVASLSNSSVYIV